MKRLLLLAVILFVSISAQSRQDSLTIRGNLKGLGNERVRIIYINSDIEGNQINQMINARNDAFSFKVPKPAKPAYARLKVGVNRSLSKTINGHLVGQPEPPLDLIVYQSNLTIKGTLENMHRATVSGDVENNAYTKFRKSQYDNWPINKKIFQLDVLKDSMQIRVLNEQLLIQFLESSAKQKLFINNNANLFLSIVFLNSLQNHYTAEGYEKAYNSLSATYKNTKIAKQIAQRIAELQPVAVGKPAINFIRNDKDGKEINLANYKGKLVLLDFWGSWCGPCRSSHPHLKELYAKYKDKGFEIIAVANEKGATLDKSRQSWLNAIEKDGIPWVHILNQEGIEQQNIVKDYIVSAYPTKILLDKDGKILLHVAASTSKDLDEMLEKLLM